MNEEFTQIAIPAFTDPQEPWRATRRVFPRDQSQPGCQLAAVFELGHVTDGGDERSRWLKALIARRGKNRAAVALANKNARIVWALLAHNQEYRVRTVV